MTSSLPVPARRHLPAIVALGACVAMVPWTVVLALTLPDRYVAHNWSTTWVGFDVLLLVSFAVTGITALAGRRHGQAFWAATIVTATLLTCDAWFDVTTASNTASLTSSLVTAVGGNLPVAALMLFLGYRSLRRATPRS